MRITGFVWLLLVLFGSTGAERRDASASVAPECNEPALDAAIAAGGTITFGCSGTIVLTSRKQISGNLTIDGGDAVILSGAGQTQLFLVAPNATLTLRHLKLVAGNATREWPACCGGIVFNQFGGALIVIDSSIESSAAHSGGGIANSGHARIERTRFEGNTATNHGGAIVSTGTLEVKDSYFAGNSGGTGGAIFTQLRLHRIHSSTFTQNVSSGVGGAIANVGGIVEVVNSTISANSADLGGGIYTGDSFIDSPIGTTTIINSTLYGNTGGALHNNEKVTITNSILAGSSGEPDCSLRQPPKPITSLTNGGGNLIQDGSCGFPARVDPQLGPLLENGGFVPTHSITVSSSAFGIGIPPVCAAPAPGGPGLRDQRGRIRWTCSAGAYEPTPDSLFRKSIPGITHDGT